jgi:transcriptional regulator with XRE-family HTH domain
MAQTTAARQRREWGSRIRDARQQAGLTQAELADLAGVDQASISRTEAGTGSFDTYIRAAKQLGLVLEVSA